MPPTGYGSWTLHTRQAGGRVGLGSLQRGGCDSRGHFHPQWGKWVLPGARSIPGRPRLGRGCGSNTQTGHVCLSGFSLFVLVFVLSNLGLRLQFNLGAK